MYINEIIWYFEAAGENTHNNILWYGDLRYIVRIPYQYKTGSYNYWKNKVGKEYAQERYDRGKSCKNTWFDIPSNTQARTANEYPTQKPYKLLERIICLSTI